LWKLQAGFDLVIFSGGKPCAARSRADPARTQNLIEAALPAMSLRRIGRGMKVGKEELCGLLGRGARSESGS